MDAMSQPRMKHTLRLAATLIALGITTSAQAIYTFDGFTPQVIQSGHELPNTAIHVDAGGLFSSAFQGVTDEDIVAPEFALSLPAGSGVRYARLNISWWGGSADYTTTLDATLNGQPLTPSPLAFGSTADANPTYAPNATSVYGAGAGMWLTCFDVTDNVALGQANQVELDLPNFDTEDFDGRCYHWEIIAVYDTPTDHLLSYEIAEGYGSLRRTVPSLTTRTIDFSGFDLPEPFDAELWLAYTHGSEEQLDWARLNGTQIGGTNDLADSSEESAFFNPFVYGRKSYFDFEQIDIADLLDPTRNELGIHTSATDGEFILNIASVVLAAHSLPVIPEPCTLALGCFGLAGLLARRRR